MFVSALDSSAGPTASRTVVVDSAKGLRYSKGGVCEFISGALSSSPIASAVSVAELSFGAGPIDLRKGVLSMIEEACANRGVEKFCIDRTSLLCGEVPNMRGTALAPEAR
jgi:hypothetical protein